MFSEKLQRILDHPEQIQVVKDAEAISNLHSVYKELFGEGIKKQCGDCLTKALLKIKKYVYLQSQKNSENFNLETMKKHEDKNFILIKGKALDIMGIGLVLTNETMTDDEAVRALVAYPNLIKYFEKYPQDSEGALDLSGFEVKTPKKAKTKTQAELDAEAAKTLAGKNGGQIIKDEVYQLAFNRNAELFGGTPEATLTTEQLQSANTAEESRLASLQNTDANKSTNMKVVKDDEKEKAHPMKAGTKRVPNEGETIADAAIRFEVSERTIERDMKSAGIDVKEWKEKTATKPAAPASAESKSESEGNDPENEDNSADGVKYIDFTVDQAWLDEHAEEAKEHDIKLGDVIEIPAEEENEQEGSEGAE